VSDSKRLKRLKKDLIEEIPRFPNDKASLQALQAMHLTDLVITFLSWKIRQVGRRPRRVKGAGILERDSRSMLLKPNIQSFLSSVLRETI